jgi:hypothetical protein
MSFVMSESVFLQSSAPLVLPVASQHSGALVTVSFYVVKTARENPVESIRNE